MAPGQVIDQTEQRDPGSVPFTEHFSTVATKYDELRFTDPEVIDLVLDSLADRRPLTLADVGCGTGRYTLELMSRLGDDTFIHFIDGSQPMLDLVRSELGSRGLSQFGVLCARAECLPFFPESLDCMLTSNAIHHFNVADFLHEARRVLRPGGLLFIYTRFRDQNARGIWGRLFPHFADKEHRLYDEEHLIEMIDDTPGLSVRDVTHFSFMRAASPAELLKRAKNRHYSTFCFYGADELEQATEVFETRLTKEYGSSQPVEWTDENVMITVERV